MMIAPIYRGEALAFRIYYLFSYVLIMLALDASMVLDPLYLCHFQRVL